MTVLRSARRFGLLLGALTALAACGGNDDAAVTENPTGPRTGERTGSETASAANVSKLYWYLVSNGDPEPAQGFWRDGTSQSSMTTNDFESSISAYRGSTLEVTGDTETSVEEGIATATVPVRISLADGGTETGTLVLRRCETAEGCTYEDRSFGLYATNLTGG